MKGKRCLIFFVLLLSLSAAAQPTDQYRIKRLGTEDGLSHRWSLCAYQDSKGFIWIGTYDGLNRYDGHDFIVYRPSESGHFPVRADVINSITETPDGNLFLSTFDGIIQFNPQQGVFEHLLARDSSEALLLLPGAHLSFLPSYFFYEGNPASFKVYERDTVGNIKLLSTSEGFPFSYRPLCPVHCTTSSAWFWDFKGSYYRYDLPSKKWTQHAVKGSTLCPVDDKNNVWLPADEQLQSFPLPSDMKGQAWETFTLEPGKAVWLYSADASKKSSLHKFDLVTQQMTLQYPSFNASEYTDHRFTAPNAPLHYIDKEGTLWFAGFLGLTHIRKRDQLFQQYLSAQKQTEDSDPEVRSIRYLAEDNAGHLYCLMNGDLYAISKSDGKFTRHSFSEKIIRVLNKSGITVERGEKTGLYSMLAGDEHQLYLGSAAGIFVFNTLDQTSKLYEIAGGAHFLLNNINDRILYINEKGNHFFHKATGTVIDYPGFHSSQYQIPYYDAASNSMWQYNDTAIINIHLQTNTITIHRIYDEPREQRCLVIHEGSIWVGTSRGLEKIDPATFSHVNYNRADGLPGNFVYSIVAEGDYLYLGTSDGLCRFNVHTSEVKNFYVEDGLSHNEFNTNSTLKARDGRIYMGGLNGINAFYPKDLDRKTLSATNVLLSRYSIFDSKHDSLIFYNNLSPVTSIVLSPSMTSINFYLALSSYIDAGNNQFAWRMEGLDENWFYSDNQHIATYRHILPGKYTFTAKASDPFGNWSEYQLRIPIVVLAPWYVRWWAWLLYAAALTTLIVAVYQNQLRKRMKHAEHVRLKELDTFKNRFFTNITHEFRTPLTVILGLTENSNGSHADPNLQNDKRSATLIRRNAESLLRLINQILDLAKLESNSLKMNYVQGDVLPYLRYITESLQSFANAQNLILRVESNEGQIIMDYDPERLQQIIHNLISNAIKFTPGGGRVTLHVGLVQHATDKTQQQLKLTVTDTGAGIPPENLPHIFDRFYQANNLEKARAGGTGIGLSLTKELVKALQGKIDVESIPGKGTTFTVTLPVTREATFTKQDAWTSDFSSPGSVSLQQPVTAIKEKSDLLPQLLLIEDNPDVIEYLITCLESDYNLEYAYNGRAGIEKAFDLTPDLIISDVMMPEKSGFEVTDALKHDQRTSHIPIVLLTAKADIESKLAGLRKGADAYLAKPFHKEELLATLSNILETRRKLQTLYLSMTENIPSQPAIDQDKTSDEGNSAMSHEENDFLTRLKMIVEMDLTNANLDVDFICKKLGMGRTNLHNKLKALTGLSITAFVRRLRLQKAKELLVSTEMNISEIAYSVGFNDPRYFSRVFSEEFGVPPSEFKVKPV